MEKDSVKFCKFGAGSAPSKSATMTA